MSVFKSAILASMLLAGQANAKSFIVALPANLSPAAQEHVAEFFGQVYMALEPKDSLTVFDASHLRRVATLFMPETIGTGKRDRIKALGPAAGQISEFISGVDAGVKADDINIPAALRDLGSTVLPTMPGGKANVLFIGSLIWENENDGNFNTRNFIPSDGFLMDAGGPFGVVGQEKVLSGALVSFCYTDAVKSFASERFRQKLVSFWGKSVVGRGGKVGAIEAYGSGCAARLASDAVDATPYAINRSEKLFLTSKQWTPVEVK
ncbi:hypothetical protein [Roseicella sp. DB1501]|uniref:hypothetical protein n=1 Tax=Roseicella sp. DB1501 TaxID=2730925 RepID=UPI0014919E49|nr:hypothetical protein [Roseicella sp. DB1501]NOG70474.1 hypothetical protein [Roseicella sp. DB1501]